MTGTCVGTVGYTLHRVIPKVLASHRWKISFPAAVRMRLNATTGRCSLSGLCLGFCGFVVCFVFVLGVCFFFFGLAV